MVQYKIEYDNVLGVRQCDYLGDNYQPGYVSPYDYNNIELFPFTRCCFSIGDWGIVSALPRILKELNPNLQFYIPTPNWISNVFPNVNGWKYQGIDPAKSVELVFANNPYVQYFDTGNFTTVFSDHDRCNRFGNEPLAKRILRYFGVDEQVISKLDVRPELYFTEEEQLIGNHIINQYTNNNQYGCILLASRLEHLNNCWDINIPSIQNLLVEIRKLSLDKDFKFFYYSSFDITKTYWADVFNITEHNFINFANIKDCPLRIQWYIKSKAAYNISYQSGFNDCVSRYSKHLIATHREGTGETTCQYVKYFQPDGSIIINT